jgi:phosphoribosylformylglycinamidine synthase
MSRPVVFILYAPGINCHHETQNAFSLAGGRPELVHLTDDLITHKKRLTDCDILVIPGGFSFGDHVAAGRIFALDLINRLQDQLLAVREKGILVIGICNGFQVLINTGLLPGTGEIGKPIALLDRNRSAVFESRWVNIYVQDSHCLWTRGLAGEALHIPVAHGEGCLLAGDVDDRQTVLRYGAAEGSDRYPLNPNGSPGGRAAICDPTGRILGMMPHPERAVYDPLGSSDGLRLLKTGVQAVA